jgi:lactate dehydrogenase-like 2-hydroxyacid dehydrogenase
MLGHRIGGKRLGIIGMGTIGKKVARLAQAFGMPVLKVESRADFPALEAGLAAPGPFAAVVRTSLEAILPR